MIEEIKKYKLFYLQKKYNNIIETLNKLEDHYNELLSNYYIENITDFSTSIYDIIKNINSYYNNQINNYLENNKTDIDILINSIKDQENNIILSIIDKYSNDIPTDIFKDTDKEINKLISKYGYKNIKSMIELLYAPNYFNRNVMDLINEINNIVIPLSYSIHNVNNISNEYYWIVPNKYNSNDLLHKKRELWIKLNNSKYIKIDIIFKIDRFSSIFKTTQIKSPFLQKHKNNILLKINTCDEKFIKTFMRHDYLGNIYCMSEIEYIDYLNSNYNIYKKLCESTLVNVMKEFINQNNTKQMFDIIILLLLGTDDMINMAGLLIGLIKDKKNSKNNISISLFEYMYNNMTYYIQTIIKKSSINVKHSIEKLKNVNIDEIDYKKQLILNKHIPNNVRTMVLEKIEEMKNMNNEYYKQLLYVKTLLNFPWSSASDDLYFKNLNKKNSIKHLTNIETKLNKSCYGHEKAKKMLIQLIGKWISNPNSMGSCLGLVGPPGVGKTLLAKSIGKALDIPFGQITLGGQNDGELLHGHGYTYSGSQPGMIIKKMVEMGKSRCILYFDELDKASSKHGTINEITSILIHLTDPNMNKTFQDRFFQGVDFPLDKVIIIFSYNDSSLIDPILLDRIKEIKVQPYTIEDKVNICMKHIIEEMAENVSMKDLVHIDEDIIRYLIDNYTNEAGVRDIKRKIEDIFLHLNIEKIYNKDHFKNKYILTKDKILEILKEPNMHKRVINDESLVGIINGLYATTNGDGGIIPIQIYPNTQHAKDKYEVRLTGKQGEVMKESVLTSLTTAIEWLKTSIYKDKIEELMNNHVKNGFHIHTPDGATPKDGPSAGSAFTCAFISRILNKPIKNNIAITGEIELTGKISKIGGLEYKLQGAKKAGIKTVYIPFENNKDLDEIKEKYKNLIDNSFNVITVKNINEVINEILL